MHIHSEKKTTMMIFSRLYKSGRMSQRLWWLTFEPIISVIINILMLKATDSISPWNSRPLRNYFAISKFQKLRENVIFIHNHCWRFIWRKLFDQFDQYRKRFLSGNFDSADHNCTPIELFSSYTNSWKTLKQQ